MMLDKPQDVPAPCLDGGILTIEAHCRAAGVGKPNSLVRAAISPGGFAEQGF